MRKIYALLLSGLVMSTTIAQAPDRTSAGPAPRPVAESIDLNEPAFYKMHPANLASDDLITRSGRGAVEFISIGTAYNLYTTLLDGQNQVSYHPDINSVTFVHRQNDGTTGGSGGLAFDVSTDGGATWTINNVVSPDYNAGTSPINGNRYPSAAIYNPPGNTNPDLAYFVGNGPALDPDAPGSWGYTFRISATLDGGNIDENYYQTPGEEYDFHPYGINYYSSGSMWDVSTTYNNSGDAAMEYITYDKYRLNEITQDGVTMDFVYNTTDFEPDFYTYTPTGGLSEENYAGYGWGVYFDPTGTTGYMVLLGGLSDADPLAISPIIYKSEDAGATWNLLPSFDFGSLTAFQDWTIPTWDGTTLPFFTSYDAAVDMNGDLHMNAQYISRSTTSSEPDSLYFIWTNFTGFMHMTVSDGTDWTADLLGFSGLGSAAIGTTGIPYRVQASRNTTGDKIFFTRTMSDSTIFTEHAAPDLLVIGYDIMSGEYTNEINITAGTDFEYSAYYATTSPVSMDDGAGTYEVPVVFTVPGADENSPPQFHYIKGITFTDDDFGAEPAAVANFTFSVGSGGLVTFNNTSSNATLYSWDFGDGTAASPLENPSHTYTADGVYNVCLTASNATSSDENCKDVNVTGTDAIEDLLAADWSVYPVPANSVVQLELLAAIPVEQIELFSLTGEQYQVSWTMSGNICQLDVSTIPSGSYLIGLISDGYRSVKPMVIQH